MRATTKKKVEITRKKYRKNNNGLTRRRGIRKSVLRGENRIKDF